ncbi:hypothetical protein [Streptomyces sp. NPDC006610]|jgi:hypothetical protein
MRFRNWLLMTVAFLLLLTAFWLLYNSTNRPPSGVPSPEIS